MKNMQLARKNSALHGLYISLVLLLLTLQGCVGASGSTYAPPTSALLSTPIPPYVSTDQASAIQARSTIQAGEAQAYSLALTGTAAAVDVNRQSTLVALHIAQSAATEQYFARQTQISSDATTTASQIAVIGTATAQSWQATSDAGTQQAVGTGTAWAATSTQIEADSRVYATATQLAVNEMIRRDESERQSLLFRTWAWRLALVLVFLFCLAMIWKAIPWLMLKFFGFQSWNGKPIVIVPDKRGGFKVVDIARSLGPGLMVDEKGDLVTTGLAPDLEMQNAITARAQAAELVLSIDNPPPEMKQRIIRQAAALSAPTPKPVISLPPELARVEFKVLPSNDQQVGEWLHEVEAHLLEDGKE